jgi:hypothetical protein
MLIHSRKSASIERCMDASSLQRTSGCKCTESLYIKHVLTPFSQYHFERCAHSLSKVIANRWKQLPASGKQFYRDVARAHQEQYELYLATSTQLPCHPV